MVAATRARATLGAAAVAALLAAASSAAAEDALRLPPWDAEQLPRWAQSVHVIAGDQPLRMGPDAHAERRGSALLGAHLPLFAAGVGPGCFAPWLQVGASAWVCADDVVLSGNPALPPGSPDFHARPDGMPYAYFFTGRDGSLAYERIEDVDVGEPAMALEPGFAVAVVEERSLGREIFGRTNRGLWIPMRDFGPARPITFHGEEVTAVDGNIPVAWVVVDRAAVFARQGAGFAPSGRSRKRFDRVDVLEVVDGWAGSYVRIDDSGWLRSKDVRHPTMAPAPDDPEIAQGARWIDIELDTQTLVAYEGHDPVFATIVSTGKSRVKGHPFETPVGVHRIWVKLLSTTMDNLEDEYASRYYRIEDVPYVQFFHKGVGLHAAFWHRSFGHVRSHGCVNLAPLDAQRLFTWTGPRIPMGWSAALPTSYDRGTIIRVR